MKKNTLILIFILFSCKILKQDKIPLLDDQKCITHKNDINNYIFEDFPNEDLKISNCEMEEFFSNKMGIRIGFISRNGVKEGYFWSAIQGKENDETISRVREEYFKKGLRDSIFKQFDRDGKIIYETTFKMGTGLWKEFHGNGKIYFEAYTKDGYFTDTLKLYDKRGRLESKKNYIKDSLVYNKDFDTNVVDTLDKGKSVKITYKQRWIDSDHQPYYIYEKKYDNKIEKYNNKEELIYLKKDTLINGLKKEYEETIENEVRRVSLYSVKANEKTFEYEKQYKNEQLVRYKYLVKGSEKQKKVYTIGYNGRGEIINKTVNENFYTGEFPFMSDKTIYFENGKEIYRSEEYIIKITYEQNIQITVTEIQKKYFDLKNNLYKIEYIVHSQGQGSVSCSRGSEIFDVDKVIITKTENYVKGKLINTLK